MPGLRLALTSRGPHPTARIPRPRRSGRPFYFAGYRSVTQPHLDPSQPQRETDHEKPARHLLHAARGPDAPRPPRPPHRHGRAAARVAVRADPDAGAVMDWRLILAPVETPEPANDASMPTRTLHEAVGVTYDWPETDAADFRAIFADLFTPGGCHA